MQATTENKEIYHALLQTEPWQKRRGQILERDDNRCVRCGSKHHLNVHHRQYHRKSAVSLFVNPWEYKSNNLVTLCSSCHQLGHKLFKVPVFKV